MISKIIYIVIENIQNKIKIIIIVLIIYLFSKYISREKYFFTKINYIIMWTFLFLDFYIKINKISHDDVWI